MNKDKESCLNAGIMRPIQKFSFRVNAPDYHLLTISAIVLPCPLVHARTSERVRSAKSRSVKKIKKTRGSSFERASRW